MHKLVIGVLVLSILSVIALAAPSVTIKGKVFQGVEPNWLSCNTQNTIDDRIACRMDANVSGTMNVWPEDCLTLSGEDSRTCLALAFAAWPCRLKDSTPEREGCFQQLLDIEQASIVYNHCLALQGSNRRVCYTGLSQDIMFMANFRLDELIDKAVTVYRMGVSKYRVVGIIKRINTAKQELLKDDTQDLKQASLRAMQHDWGLFAQQAREELNATK